MSADTAATDPGRTFCWGRILAGVLIVAYAAIFAGCGGASFQDLPNHLARAVVMSDLLFHDGVHFGATFHYHFEAVPYILGDLILASAVDLVGPHGAAMFWIALTVLSLPLAVLFYLRGTDLPTPFQVLLVILCLYLSTDGFLYMGFFTFRLAVALTLAGLALAQRFRQHPSAGVLAAYCGLLVVGYLVHLASLLFLAVAVGISGLVLLAMRGTKLRRETALYVPIAAVATWHFRGLAPSGAPGDLPPAAFKWGSWAGKLHGLRWDWLRYYDRPLDGRLDNLLGLATVLCVAWALRGYLNRRSLTRPAVLELAAIAAAFLALYLILPSAYGDASYLDLRPLAMVPLFLILAGMQLAAGAVAAPASQTRAHGPLFLAASLAVFNLGYLTAHMVRDGKWADGYRAVVAAIPPGSRVLPLYPGTDRLRPYMHAGAYAVIDRAAIIPYLFSGNRGNPQTYFRYDALPYSPPEVWYYSPPVAASVDWNSIRCTYDYLLAMKPFDLHRVPIATQLVTQNPQAILLAVGGHDCTQRQAFGV